MLEKKPLSLLYLLFLVGILQSYLQKDDESLKSGRKHTLSFDFTRQASGEWPSDPNQTQTDANIPMLNRCDEAVLRANMPATCGRSAPDPSHRAPMLRQEVEVDIKAQPENPLLWFGLRDDMRTYDKYWQMIDDKRRW